MKSFAIFLLILTTSMMLLPTSAPAQTVALWLFDEQQHLYPSSVLNESGENDYPLVLGPGGSIVPGKFGNALLAVSQPEVTYPSGSVHFGLENPEFESNGEWEPLTWMNAGFCALMTSGENHLRKEVGFANATETQLNLGDFDWTVEFWLGPGKQQMDDGVIFEIGSGPRGKNDLVTRLILNKNSEGFTFLNYGEKTRVNISSRLADNVKKWHHCAFTYDSHNNQISHFLDGKLQSLPQKIRIQKLPVGEEAYFTLGRDGMWQHPLASALDELRFSAARLYLTDFEPPPSFAAVYKTREGVDERLDGPPLLFVGDNLPEVVELGDRRHLFIDDALIETMENVTFRVNPPRLAEKVVDNIDIPFRKHLSIIEDLDGVIRMYNGTYNDYLAVRISSDGIHWEMPDLERGEIRGLKNIVIPEPTAMGSVFIDPNAPPERRWKYVSDYHRRGIYLYSSPDGWSFERHKIAVLPFRSGSQSNVFYDEQRQLYVGYHRSDCTETPGGDTQRTFVLTEVRDILSPWPFSPIRATAHDFFTLRHPQPWYLDNGPLTPGGFCLEYPVVFYPDSSDPVGTDIYVPKAEKYAWAPDTYVAFPVTYFHYEDDGPETRRILMHPDRQRGSGPIETQLAVSRDGIHWKKYHRPTYVGIGQHHGIDVHQAYLAQGMVRRGDELWQYYYGTSEYHSPWVDDNENQAVFRVVQRLDGFVSINAPYQHDALFITKPLVFKGKVLVLNIDTDAAGYCQVGILDEKKNPIPGFSVEDCIYINGDFIGAEVEWLTTGKDVSSLAGKPVHLVFRMRGSRLYALQFRE